MSDPKYNLLAEDLDKQGVRIEVVKDLLKQQHIETPSWGYGNSGTRFGVFQQPGAARNVHERLEDAATVHRFTGIAPTVALHIPWDETDDWAGMKQYAGNSESVSGQLIRMSFKDKSIS